MFQKAKNLVQRTCGFYPVSSNTKDSEKGASLVEYALLLALIVVVSIGAVTTLGGVVDDPLVDVNTGLITPAP